MRSPCWPRRRGCRCGRDHDRQCGQCRSSGHPRAAGPVGQGRQRSRRLPVTVEVGPLPPTKPSRRRSPAGESEAHALAAGRGLIHGAVLLLQGANRVSLARPNTAPCACCNHVPDRNPAHPCVTVEEIRHEFGPPPAKPLRRGMRSAPCSPIPMPGAMCADIMPMMEALEALGPRDGQSAWPMPRAASPGDRRLWQGRHRRQRAANSSMARCGMCRAAMRCARSSGDAKAIVPSAKKVGGPGTRLDVPITHINASYVRSHFDAIEVGRAGRAAARDEIIVHGAGDDDGCAHSCPGGRAQAPKRSRERMGCDESEDPQADDRSSMRFIARWAAKSRRRRGAPWRWR